MKRSAHRWISTVETRRELDRGLAERYIMPILVTGCDMRVMVRRTCTGCACIKYDARTRYGYARAARLTYIFG